MSSTYRVEEVETDAGAFVEVYDSEVIDERNPVMFLSVNNAVALSEELLGEIMSNSDKSGEKSGQRVGQFEIDDAYMCVNCTTLRYGDPQGACPVCETQDVAVLDLNLPSRETVEKQIDQGETGRNRVQCEQCGRRHPPGSGNDTHGRDQIECNCGNYIVECAYCDRYVSVMTSASGPDGKPVHKHCFKKEDYNE